MEEFTKEQILDALCTHKTVQKAAKALGLSYPKMQHWLRKYDITKINIEAEPVAPKQPWYKRFFTNGKKS